VQIHTVNIVNSLVQSNANWLGEVKYRPAICKIYSCRPDGAVAEDGSFGAGVTGEATKSKLLPLEAAAVESCCC
jgi:hypothetical protein